MGMTLTSYASMSLRHALEVGNQFRRPPADIHTQPGHGYWQWAPMHRLFYAVPGGENALFAAPHAASMTLSHLLHIYAAVDPLVVQAILRHSYITGATGCLQRGVCCIV
ncbi:hypothetical protein PsYK624_047560 [Phanerochaete sordida]|uniref:Uncharacterized protein n=1 Tax=Phanerochaete sordida TaxID=48140 RepID=A0A9P3G5I8_9APHY|nr:hypothetical protein PsYK624_047560 [Phanerochaete sordida]